MKDKIEQLYISAIQGEWDSEYFAERMMELVEVPTMLTLPELSKEDCERMKKEFDKFYRRDTNNFVLKTIEKASNPEHGIMFWKDGTFYSDVECTKEFKRK